MPAKKKQTKKKKRFNRLDCPTCGNEITVKIIESPQKCEWCRRYYKVHTKTLKSGKIRCSAEAMNFKIPSPVLKK